MSRSSRSVFTLRSAVVRAPCGGLLALVVVDVRLPNPRTNRRLGQLHVARDLACGPVRRGNQLNNFRLVIRREGPSLLLRDHEPPFLDHSRASVGVHGTGVRPRCPRHKDSLGLVDPRSPHIRLYPRSVRVEHADAHARRGAVPPLTFSRSTPGSATRTSSRTRRAQFPDWTKACVAPQG